MEAAVKVSKQKSSAGLAVVRSLEWAALVLNQLMLDIDKAPVLTDELVAEFHAAANSLAAKLDRRRALDLKIQSEIQLTDSMLAALRVRKFRLQDLQNRNRKQVQSAMELNPGVPFLDSAKRPLRLQKNPPTVDFAFDLHERKFTNIITAEAAKEHNIADEYLERVSFLRLRVDLARANAIAKTDSLPWAVVTQGVHTRGWDKLTEDENAAVE